MHNHHHENKKILKVSLSIIFVYMFVELIGGWVTNSLALLSDAGHMFSDAAALLLSLVAFTMGERHSNENKTYGYQRFEILAATINGLVLFLISIWIIIEAIIRLNDEPEIASAGMLIVSTIGLLVNLYVAWYMHKGSDTTQNINMRSAYIHVLGDLLGSVGAIVAAVLMIIFEWTWADSVVSIFVSLLILKSAWSILKNTFHILMEGKPQQINTDEVIQIINDVSEVKSIHDLHIWSITSNFHVMTCHIVVNELLKVHEVQKITALIESKLQEYGINHVTIQIESDANDHSNSLLCHSEFDHNQHHHHDHSHQH